VNSLEYFYIGVSWGGFESLVYAPAISYLKEMTPDKFEAMGITLGSIRLSIGLEDIDDLIADLDKALKCL
ncbi:MAG: PLP-dependent transferase, partial [Paraclostridium sp.]